MPRARDRHGRRAGHARRAAARGARRGERDRRRRHRATAAAPAPQRVPPHRAARPGAHHRVRARLRARRSSSTSASTSPTRGSADGRRPRRARRAPCTCSRRRRRPAISSGSRVRSGLEVYGRGRGRPVVPAEDAPLAPTSPYGRTCLEVETLAAALVRRLGIPVAALRLAPVVGSHVPSPLGRVLRLPLVPVPALADPAFVLLHQEDAARAMVEAVMRSVDGPVNVVGPRRGEPVAGGAARWAHPDPGVRAGVGRRPAHRRDRRRAGAAARRRAAAPRTGRRRHPRRARSCRSRGCGPRSRSAPSCTSGAR